MDFLFTGLLLGMLVSLAYIVHDVGKALRRIETMLGEERKGGVTDERLN